MFIIKLFSVQLISCTYCDFETLIVHQCICYNSLYFQFQLYYAEFEFASRNENEVSLFEHQVVMVINPHDQNGNPEWWYVEADGVYGYAPSSYLRKMDTH